MLGIISTLSKICGALVLAFAQNDYQIYMGMWLNCYNLISFLIGSVTVENNQDNDYLSAPLVEILNGTTTIALRSIASKLVSYQELGKY